MTLGEKQRKFSGFVGKLIVWTYENGYELSLGEAYRDPRMQAIYIKEGKSQKKDSLHTQCLAIDLNLFKDGNYLDKAESYEPLGKFWKSLDPECIWGGDWTTLKDGDHFQYGR